MYDVDILSNSQREILSPRLHSEHKVSQEISMTQSNDKKTSSRMENFIESLKTIGSMTYEVFNNHMAKAVVGGGICSIIPGAKSLFFDIDTSPLYVPL